MTTQEKFHGLPQKIGKLFEKFNTERNSQLGDIKALRERIYGIKDHKNDTWGSDLMLPDLYEQCQTLKAHVLDSIYSSAESLFDVSAQNGETTREASAQKAMLVENLEKMKIGAKLEKMVEDLIETGECTLFVGWETRYRKHRRAASLEERLESGESFVTQDKLVYDGVTVKTIAAQDFVFDSVRSANWDGCAKIFRTYLDIEDIKADSTNVYLTQEVVEALKQNVSRFEKGEDIDGIRQGQVEILEYWGDIELDDGQGGTRFLRNQFVVCAGRTAILRFEDNPFVTAPFIYANLIENPETKRGISPLKPVLALNTVASRILNNQLDAYSLIINPPYLAPKGAFKGQQKVSPGKIVEYDSSLLPQSPTPLNFSSALCGWDFINYFKGSIESTTGIYRTMAGDNAGAARTATEMMYSANGQNARLNMVINAVNRKLIVPMVEKVAETVANFKYGEETIIVRLDDKQVPVTVDDTIRGGDYVYRYSDKKATLERKFRSREVSETIAAFSKIPGFSEKINWNECFKFALEQLGVENSRKYLET